jgi:GTP-binding protein
MTSFVDTVRIHLRAGDGGAGVASFRRQKGKPKGKPEGGSGGAGGDVILRVDDSMSTLLRYRYNPHHRAGSGTHGEGDFRHGRRGDTLVLPVPPGTVVRDEDATLIADLVAPGQEITVLTGGRGGLGNGALVSPQHRAPGFAEQGEYGPGASFILELKLLADAALIGLPNAGKSTLIASVSAAKPKIADYPFTTLHPNLGVVSVGDSEFVLADIPGLIEGAAEGRGLGHEFLRHVERAMVLVVLLDPSPLQELSIVEQYDVLMRELRVHSAELMSRPRLVAVTKVDLGPVPDGKALAAELDVDRVFQISAATHEGVDDLMYAVSSVVRRTSRELPEREGFILHRPVPPPFEIRRVGTGWEVLGRAAVRATNLADLTMAEAADVAAERLQLLGVNTALAAEGAVRGDIVRIGDLEFEFLPDAYGWEDDDEWSGEEE